MTPVGFFFCQILSNIFEYYQKYERNFSAYPEMWSHNQDQNAPILYFHE